MRLQPGTAGDPGQYEAPALGLIAGAQGLQSPLDLLDGLLQQLGEQARWHRLDRNQQDGLYRPPELVTLHRPSTPQPS